MKKYLQINKKSGFSLIEVLISVLLVMTVGTASIALHFNSYRLAERAALQTQAYFLADEAIDRMTIDIKLGFELGEATYYMKNGTYDVLEQDAPIKMNGNRYIRFIEVKKVYGDSFYRITSSVCFGPQAVSLPKCYEGRSQKKNYIEAIAVVE